MVSTSRMLVVARIGAGVIVATLVISWPLHFKSSFLLLHHSSSTSSSSQNLVFAVMHPLLMVIGFIIISGEAIMVHRWLPGTRSWKKLVHLGLQGVALGSGVFGIWTKFNDGEDGFGANFFSLHSWMGFLCISLFAAQWVMGFKSFWHRGEARTARATVLPWHVFLGLYTYGLAVATAETGLLEKVIFMQIKRRRSSSSSSSINSSVSKHCPESIVVNSLGLFLALLGGIVILTAVSPQYRRFDHQPKLVYSQSENSKCLSA